MSKMVWLDMDGTIANLYKGEWLNDIRNENVRPYEIADRLVEENVLLNLVKNGYKLGIISWLAKNGSAEYNARVSKAKREWLANNYPNIHFEIHIVEYGFPKEKINGANGQILVDDEEPNRKNWIGKAYTPEDFFRK